MTTRRLPDWGLSSRIVALSLLLLLLVLLPFLLLLLLRLLVALWGILQHAFQQIPHMVQVVSGSFVVRVPFQDLFIGTYGLFKCGNDRFLIAESDSLFGDLRDAVGVFERGVNPQPFVAAGHGLPERIPRRLEELDGPLGILQRGDALPFLVIGATQTVIDDFILRVLDLQVPVHFARALEISAVQQGIAVFDPVAKRLRARYAP